MSEKEYPAGIVPISSAYVCLVSTADQPGAKSSQAAVPVIGIAPHSSGAYRAVVLDIEGNAVFSAGPVRPAPSGKALEEIARAMKANNR